MANSMWSQESELGLLMGEFRSSQVPLFLSLLIGVAGLIGATFAFLRIIQPGGVNPGTIFWLILSLVALYVGVRRWLTEIKVGQRRIAIYQDGLTYSYKGFDHRFRWDDITTVWRNQTTYYRSYYGSGRTKEGTNWTYNLLHHDGTEIVLLSRLFPDFPRLAGILDQEVTGRLINKAIEMYDSGKPVDFDDFAMGQDGIAKDGVRVGWDDIGRFDFPNGQVRIVRKGDSKPWYLADFYNIPNGPVIPPLLHHIVKSQNAASIETDAKPAEQIPW